MAIRHSGNMQNEILFEEHQGDINAKRVSLVSAPTIYIIGDIGLTPTLGSRATYSNATTTAVPLLIYGADTQRRSILLRNISSATVFVGFNSSVSTSQGMPLTRDDTLMIDQSDRDIYAVSDSTGHSIRWIAELD